MNIRFFAGPSSLGGRLAEQNVAKSGLGRMTCQVACDGRYGMVYCLIGCKVRLQAHSPYRIADSRWVFHTCWMVGVGGVGGDFGITVRMATRRGPRVCDHASGVVV